MPRLTAMEDIPGTRVLLVDDNLDFLKAAVDFLRRRPELVLVGATNGGEQALAEAANLDPQVILIDLEMPGLTNLETIPRLREMLPGVGIVGLTLLDSRAYLKAAQGAGAHAIVSKSKLVSDLLPAIRRITRAGTPTLPRDLVAEERTRQLYIP